MYTTFIPVVVVKCKVISSLNIDVSKSHIVVEVPFFVLIVSENYRKNSRYITLSWTITKNIGKQVKIICLYYLKKLQIWFQISNRQFIWLLYISKDKEEFILAWMLRFCMIGGDLMYKAIFNELKPKKYKSCLFNFQ